MLESCGLTLYVESPKNLLEPVEPPPGVVDMDDHDDHVYETNMEGTPRPLSTSIESNPGDTQTDGYQETQPNV